MKEHRAPRATYEALVRETTSAKPTDAITIPSGFASKRWNRDSKDAKEIRNYDQFVQEVESLLSETLAHKTLW